MNIRDFVVFWDSESEPESVLVERILYSLFVKRLKANKPVIAAVIAKSGEGKSWAMNKLFEALMSAQGISLVDNLDFFRVGSVTNPLQYSEKVDKILTDKAYKKLNVLNIHDAGMLNEKNWQSFINLVVSDVNNLSRKLKPLALFYIAQYIKSVGSQVRPTLTHYITLSRPLKGNSRMTIEIVYNDERDLEKPKLRKRRVSGFVVDPKDGSYQRFVPSYFEMSPPSKALIAEFDILDYEGKEVYLKNKLSKLLAQMKAEIGDVSERVSLVLDYYKGNPDLLSVVAHRGKRGWKLNSRFREVHDFTVAEERLFSKRLNESLKDKGFLSEDKEEEGLTNEVE